MPTSTSNQVSNEQPTRRSRAVWGPPLLNASQFAIMVEDNTNSLSATSSINENEPEIIEPVIKSPRNTEKAPVSPNGLNVISFPSPCVDKGVFHVKQVQLPKSDTNSRLSWLASVNDEDSKQDVFKEDTTFCVESSDESQNTITEITQSSNKPSPKTEPRKNSPNRSFEFSSDYSKIIISPMTPSNPEKVALSFF